MCQVRRSRESKGSSLRLLARVGKGAPGDGREGRALLTAETEVAVVEDRAEDAREGLSLLLGEL